MLYLKSEQVRQQTTTPQVLFGDPPTNTDWPSRFAELAQSSQHPLLQKYYAAGMVNGDTLIKDAPLLAVDFETTGLNPNKDGIISIGAMPMTLQRIKLSGARHWLTRPRQDLTDASVVIHGITHSDIESAPDFEEILEELLDMFAGYVWVVHYRGIERPFLNSVLQSRIGETLEFPLIDTMALEARLHRRDTRSWWEKLLGRQQAKASIRLADSRERYNLPFYQPHNAATDALACGELLQAQVSHYFSPETPLRDIWVP